ncbi:MAG: hypothetical protein KDD53_01545 [Bdellovibrionales bacterium]|nr:hypothetical protein [Bdellovibrionales bacterium]
MAKECFYLAMEVSIFLSAHWYLILKNYILASKVLPKSVFVFYRDTVLTEPELRTTGAYRTKTERLQLDQEPEFRKIAIERCQPTLHSDTNRYSHLFPLVQFRDKANLIINNTALSFALVSSDQRPQFLAKVNKIFHYAELRSDLVGDDLGGLDNEITKKTFRESLNCSFLPLIIELCKTHGMKLNFIRVQKRPTIKGAAKRSAALVAYLKDLDSYLEGAGVGTFDLTGDPKIRLRWYADGDHIAPKYKQEYTRHFFELFYKEFYDIS